MNYINFVLRYKSNLNNVNELASGLHMNNSVCNMIWFKPSALNYSDMNIQTEVY